MTKKDILILILAVGVGFAVCWFFFRPQPEVSTVNLQPLIEKREDVIREIEKIDSTFFEVKETVKSEHEIIDTTDSADDLREITSSILARHGVRAER